MTLYFNGYFSVRCYFNVFNVLIISLGCRARRCQNGMSNKKFL